MASYGTLILESRSPDDFGDMYVPFQQEARRGQDDGGNMIGGRFVWPPGMLEARRLYYLGWEESSA